MTYTVVFSPEASAHLLRIYRYIAKAASPAIAQRFTDAIVDHCERFREFPERAIRRDDIRPGLHITNYQGRVVIAFAVEASEVSIVGVFYGGQDYESQLQSDIDD
jgi:plasmid stabilization system protein ParE